MTKPKPEDKKQSERFIKKARELETDESGEAFERAFKKVVPEKPSHPNIPPRQTDAKSGH